MSDEAVLPNIPGYVDIKEAARVLDVAESSVYRYVQSGRLNAYQAGRNIMIELEELRRFKPNITGRPRKKNSLWRISPDTSAFIVTYIRVNVRADRQEELKDALWRIKQEERHLFPGTVMRYISINNTVPESVTLQLVWKKSDMPDAATREQELVAFKNDLAEMLDWNTAQYSEETVLIHT